MVVSNIIINVFSVDLFDPVNTGWFRFELAPDRTMHLMPKINFFKDLKSAYNQ